MVGMASMDVAESNSFRAVRNLDSHPFSSFSNPICWYVGLLESNSSSRSFFNVLGVFFIQGRPRASYQPSLAQAEGGLGKAGQLGGLHQRQGGEQLRVLGICEGPWPSFEGQGKEVQMEEAVGIFLWFSRDYAGT